ncbi:DNA repair protein complementing XP-C cells [Parambassis ranga]|uniref:DNA repair protein complementing XP-C cells n=1 Tax=Parambassis ranga TaxID=210632 RepID=A0A6P7IE27_9TELE|nr:DNA repair protein complementing XP-C cells [Parambassis ranga]
MAKRRDCAETPAVSKKLKQVLKAKSSGGKAAAKKKGAGDDDTEKEEKLKRKVHPKPRKSSKAAAGNTASLQSDTSTAVTTSKYFQSPPKEEPESEDDFDMVTSPRRLVKVNAKKPEKEEEDSEEDFDMVTSPRRLVKVNIKKPEEEEEEEAGDSEEDEDDWEEVEELSEPLGPGDPPEPLLPSQPVEIEIETPEVRKKQKAQAEFETYLRRMMNRYKKDLLMDTHKVHLMCLIASGMFHNSLCSEQDLLAVTLSLLPAHFSTISKERVDQNYLCGLLKWFRTTFTLNPSLPCEERPDPRALLERRLASLSARNHKELTHLFLLILRSLQLFCRLVLSLQPVPFKPPSGKGKGAGRSTGVLEEGHASQETSKTNSSEPKVSPGTKRPAAGGDVKGGRGGGGKKAKKKETKGKPEEEAERATQTGGHRRKLQKRCSVSSKVCYKETDSEEDGEGEGIHDDEEYQVTSEEDTEEAESEAKTTKSNKGKGKSNNKKTASERRRSGGGKKTVKDEDRQWEEEEEEGMSSNRTKRRSGVKKEGPGADEWLEVYLEKTSSWICVDVDHGVGMPHLCVQSATAPLTYVVSVDGDGSLKDLGRKYDPTWMTSTRKRRVDEDWWEETLQPFLGPEDEKDIKEDKELQNKLLSKPLPVSITEYKNHPLYALKRHLLKYEAIYPPTATVQGYCRGEPVYSRSCVHTLHSRDTWLKEARTVRLGEEPYKMVKGFSNNSRKARKTCEQKDEKDLPLFGEWQTEEYQPPIAVDGKVPCNDYGNVYLFKPCMLPVGCVHVRLPNLHRVARKLNIDTAAAVTGFDFHGGFSHPVTDGYIVCEEHEEVLRAAWLEEQEIQKQKEKEKREKRAISNWTLLVKGLIIRERLKQRYSKKNQTLESLAREDDNSGLSSDEEPAEGGSGEAKTASETLAMSWPQNRQAEVDGESGSKQKKKKRVQEKHLFPFEKM